MPSISVPLCFTDQIAFNLLNSFTEKKNPIEKQNNADQDLPIIYLAMRESILNGGDLDNKYIFHHILLNV